MKCILIVLFLTVSCTSVPKHVLKAIRKEKLAGYWETKTWQGRTNFVTIKCNGEIKYDLKDETALIMREDRDEGKIKRIRNGEIAYKSWTSLRRGKKYTKPEKKEDGCYRFYFAGHSLDGEPTDCSKPEQSFMEIISEGLDAPPSKCYSK